MFRGFLGNVWGIVWGKCLGFLGEMYGDYLGEMFRRMSRESIQIAM